MRWYLRYLIKLSSYMKVWGQKRIPVIHVVKVGERWYRNQSLIYIFENISFVKYYPILKRKRTP